MSKILQSSLAHLARAVVRRQHPTIVGVTGSVGKTSTRDAIRVVLAADRSVRAAPKNYNNEVGLPVAIIGGQAPGRSLLRWFGLFLRGCALALVRALRYPETLILEYGADHPGDITYLMRIAAPSIAVLTAVGPAHVEFFGSLDRIAAEKRKLIAALPRSGVAVLSADDDRVVMMRDRVRAKVLTFGLREGADVRGIEYQVTYAEEEHSIERHAATRVPTGFVLKMIASGSVVPVHVRDCLGSGHASAVLGAAAVGIATGMHLVEISHALTAYRGPPGRMRIIRGVKHTTLIDDTYNSSPLAVASALETIVTLAVHGKRVLVLGDMLELGAMTEHTHTHVGELIASRPIDVLVCVGEASRSTASEARARGMGSDRVVEFSRSSDAGRFVQDLLGEGDVVLVKGSQGMRMEQVVRELMAEPLRAKELLCRQEQSWTES